MTTPQLGISARANQTLTSLRAAFIVPAAAAKPTDKLLPPKMRDAMRPKAHPLISASPVRNYALRDGWLEPTLPKGARAGVLKPSKVRLGRVASQVARVQDEHSGAWISVHWAQAKESTGKVADGYVVYDGALGAGSTALTRADVRGAEQYVRVPSGGPRELRYTIELGDTIAGLRQVRGTDVLEFVDGQGTPRLRMTAPMGLTSSGERVDLRLRVADCRVDREPRAPWGRAITALGQSACEVVVSWAGEKGSGDVLVDPAWTTTGSLAQGRYKHTASVLQNGRVLIAGGYDSDSVLAGAEVYDPSTGTWTTTGSMAQKRDHHTASVLQDGRILVTGGLIGPVFLTSTEVYDPSTGAWMTTGSMSQERSGYTASVLRDGRVLIAGGFYSSQTLTSAEVYDPSTGAWTTTGSMAQGRGHHTASVLQDGRVLVVGGWDVNLNSYFASAEVYDPSTGAWTTTFSMVEGRFAPTASLLQNGRVLVAGGDVSSGALASAEVYDPSTDAWATTGSMAQRRSGHTASVLQDGRVLVAGGRKNAAFGLASTELFALVALGGGCAHDVDCLSDHCADGVCCDAGCEQLACIQSRTGKPDGTCAHVMNGASCSSDSECGSGHCVDGVCCDNACDSLCESCDGSDTVSGNPGTCSPILEGTDPEDECAVDTSNPCGTTGMCDGNRQCAMAPSTKECGTVCDGNATITKRCSGSGQCEPVASSSKLCEPYACSSVTGQCKNACAHDTDCANGYDCTDSKCVKGNGTAPQETDVSQDNGCGCSVPGRHHDDHPPWAPLAFALAAWTLFRRRIHA